MNTLDEYEWALGKFGMVKEVQIEKQGPIMSEIEQQHSMLKHHTQKHILWDNLVMILY